MKNDTKDIYFQILKALGDGVRFDIVMLLITGPKCVCKIFEELKLKQSIVSHHLGVVKENDLVKISKNGKWIYYSLNRKKLVGLQNFIEKIIFTKETKSKC